MRKIVILTLIAIISMSIASSCALVLQEHLVNPTHKKGEIYLEVYNEKPMSVLILPAIVNLESDTLNKNDSVADFYGIVSNVTATEVLSQRGYYVVSPTLTDSIFKLNPIQLDTANISDIVTYAQKNFGVDMVVFITVNKWRYRGYLGTYTDFDYHIYSTKTQKLFMRRKVIYDRQEGAGNFLTTSLYAARLTHVYAFSDLPFGPYNLEKYMNDHDDDAYGPVLRCKLNPMPNQHLMQMQMNQHMQVTRMNAMMMNR